MNRPTPPLLELVICTYNNASMLDLALSSLARQEPSTQEDWTCLVVDNNSTDATADVVAGHMRAGRIPGLRLVHEPVQGLTPARLRGVVSTTAPWIGFIDDDCLLRDDWVRNGIHFALEHPTAGGFGGRVALDWEQPPRGYVKRHGWCFAEQDHGPAERIVPALAGAGLVLRRTAIEESGWVDEPLLADRVGHELTSGGDVEMSLRVAGSGHELWYTPACELRHRIPERRTSFAYVAAMTRALGASQAYADALVWKGSVASWLAMSVGRLCRAALVSSAMIPAAIRSRTRAADLAISLSFLFGRTRGYYRVVRMDRDRRQALIGGAHPTRRLRAAAPPGSGRRRAEAARMSDFRPWKVLDLRLNEPLPSLAGKADVEGYWVVFWWHDTPLGHLAIPSFQLPMTSASLAARASRAVAPSVGRLLVDQGFEAPLPVPRRKQQMQVPPKLASLLELDSPLSTLSRTARRAPSGQASIAVAVCTRERPAELARCLASLSALSPPPREIVVVDNAPTSDATRTVTKDVPGVRYVREPRAGLAVARNTAVGATTADILAFTDDDVTVAPDWIAGVQGAFADPEVLAVTGLILPAELETEAQYAFQLAGEKWGYRSVDFGPDFFATMRARGVPVWRIGAGANMAFRRRAFDLVGYFDERLGAGASGCSEDSEMWYRLLAEGHRCRYEASAVVFHHHRSDWDSLSAQLHSYMRGHTVALLVQFERYRHWGNLYRIAVGIPAYYGRRALRQAVRGVLPQAVRRAKTASLPLTPQVRGYLSGVWYYLRHQEAGAGADLRSHAR